MLPDRETLPNDPAVGPQDAALHEQYEQQLAQLNDENRLLREQIALLRQLLFGRSSERLPSGADSVQLPLFDLPEPEQIEPAKVRVEPHERKKPGRKPLPPELPRVEVVHDLPEADKVCGCGCALTLQRNLFLETFQFHLLSPVRKVRPMVSLLGPSNKPNHHFNIKGPHRQDCS